MTFIKSLKAILTIAICLALTACAGGSLRAQLNKYEGQRVGLVSDVGNTAMMSIHASSPLKALVYNNTTCFQQSFAQLQLDRTITQIAAKSLKQKYPNLIVIPNQTQNMRSEFSKFDKYSPSKIPNRKRSLSIIKKYRLDRLFVITYGPVKKHDGNLERDRRVKFGIRCIRRFRSKYTADYFATWQLIDINAKDYAKASFWNTGFSVLNQDQSENFLGASSLGLHPDDKAELCNNLLNKKLTPAEKKNFTSWIKNYYKTSAKKYLNK